MIKHFSGIPFTILAEKEEGSWYANIICPICKKDFPSGYPRRDEDEALKDAEDDVGHHLLWYHKDIVDEYEKQQEMKTEDKN